MHVFGNACVGCAPAKKSNCIKMYDILMLQYYMYKGVSMVVYEGVRSFQKYMTKYINGSDIVIIEDAKTHLEKVFLCLIDYIHFLKIRSKSLSEKI